MKIIKNLGVALSLTAAAMTTPLPTTAGNLDDATIVAIFDQANMADIATARLGAKKGHSKEVRELAKMVATDHMGVQRMGRDLASKLGVLGPRPAGDGSWMAQAEARAMLDRLEGPAFDAAYLKYEVGYHTAVIDAINTTLLPSIENAELKALVLKVLPGFEHHLAITKKTADKLGVAY